jgi:hypothetical protein
VLSLNVNGLTIQLDADLDMALKKPQESGTGANT